MILNYHDNLNNRLFMQNDEQEIILYVIIKLIILI